MEKKKPKIRWGFVIAGIVLLLLAFSYIFGSMNKVVKERQTTPTNDSENNVKGTDNTPVVQEPPKPKYSVNITSGTCKLLKIDSYGDRHWSVDVSGTASGPEKSELQLVQQIGGYATPKYSCSSWGASIAGYQTCARNNGEPETSAWTYTISDMTEHSTFAASGYRYDMTARIFMNNNLAAEDEIEIQCPAK
jgi:hypothetical protein